MQFVEGETFEQKIVEAGQGARPQEAVRVGIEVLQARSSTRTGRASSTATSSRRTCSCAPTARVKVTDFGIAKMIGQTRLTSTGQTMGTVRYMSPEQVRGKAVDARSDIYSLGVTLYEALAGDTPFDGENQFDADSFGQVGGLKFDDPTHSVQAALEKWVEKDKAPGAIIASKVEGNGRNDAEMTRPLCPYPQAAKYKGTGDTDDAGNFVCEK